MATPPLRAGIGYSELFDSAQAAAAATRAALADGQLDGCDLLLLFATAEHTAAALLAGARGVVGERVPVVGGGAVGAVTHQQLGYGGSQVAVAALRLTGVSAQLLAEGGLDSDTTATGQRLGQRLRAAALPPATPLLLLYDSVRSFQGRPELNMAAPLLAGLEQGYGAPLPPLAGVGLIGDIAGRPAGQWNGASSVRQQAVVLALTGAGLHMESIILHGCAPASGYHTITRAEGPVVLEIDQRPALERVMELLGSSGLSAADLPFFLTLGVNVGDRWAAFDEANYQNRLCLAVDQQRNGLVMFEPDLIAGSQVQLMHRRFDLDYIPPRVAALRAACADRQPLFALYINCAGRAAAYSGLAAEDADAVRRALGPEIPLLGIYSGVEIAPLRGRPHPLDWTGVLCLFSAP